MGESLPLLYVTVVPLPCCRWCYRLGILQITPLGHLYSTSLRNLDEVLSCAGSFDETECERLLRHSLSLFRTPHGMFDGGTWGCMPLIMLLAVPFIALQAHVLLTRYFSG